MADRISSLPPDLRNHIISFLPTEEAIKTSLLSHQWRNIVSSLPNLDFNFNSFSKQIINSHQSSSVINKVETNFINYVDHVLFRRRCRDSILKKACFSITRDYYKALTSDKVNQWIMNVVSHSPEELDLDIVSNKLPNQFFTCNNKLEKLRLIGLNLELPEIMCFPLLKSMTLSGVAFYNDDLTEKLFSSCPKLEELIIMDCELMSSKLSVVSDSVRSLRIMMECDSWKKIKICAPNLRDIEYRCNVIPSITSETIVSVVSVSFLLNAECSKESDRYLFDVHARSIWMGLNGVTSLFLYHELYIECLARNLLTYLPTSFVGLKLLGLSLCPTNENLQALRLLCGAYPNLQHLKIYFTKKKSELMLPKKDQHSQEQFHGDELKCLKSVVIYSFQEHENQVGFVKYLLRKAIILEKLEINYLRNHRQNIKTTTMLSKLSKVSPHAALLFS